MPNISSFKINTRNNLDLGLEMVRIYLGIGLFVKGVYFVLHGQALLEILNRAGHLNFGGTLFTHLTGLAHIGGGALLALGLGTRIGAAIQLPVLIGALWYVSIPQGLFTPGQSFEFTAFVLFLLMIFTVFGGGRWSLDSRLFREKEQPNTDK